MAKFRTNRSKAEVEDILRSFSAALKGRGYDKYGLAEAYRSALIHSLLSSTYEAYLIKSLGGTDDTGASWPPLKPETKAYHKPSLRKGIDFPGPKLRPTLTAKQDAAWRSIFVSEMNKFRSSPESPEAPNRRRPTPSPTGRKGLLSRAASVLSRKVQAVRALFIGQVSKDKALMSSLGIEEAQAAKSAASKAWNIVKAKLGAETLMMLFGDARAPILVETGRLLESYNPGPKRFPFFSLNFDQSIRVNNGRIAINSVVPYKPKLGSSRSPIPPDISLWVRKAKAEAKKAVLEKLREVL